MTPRSKETQHVKLCVYCGGKANSEDHIPSRNLVLPNERDRTRFIKVDSCIKCNRGFSKDEEFFRNYITSFSQEHSDKASILFNTSIKRSIERRPAIGRAFLRNMSLTNIYTPSGLYLGKRTKIELRENDLSRIFNVMDKYIKGLASFIFRLPVPQNHIIRHSWTDENDPCFQEKKLQDVLAWNKENFETFIYGYARVPDSFQSIWVCIFFKTAFFISFIYPEDSHAAKIIPKNIICFRPKPF